MAAELWFRIDPRDRDAELSKRKADDAMERINRATERIKRMTRIYQERLDGKRIRE